MKNESLWEIYVKFKIFMRKVKSLLKQITPLQICSAPFLNSPECDLSEKNTDGNQMDKLIALLGELAYSLFGLINNNGLKFYL